MKLPSLFKSKAKNFFLLIGAGRSGTSLLAALLDYHPEIEMGMEQFSSVLLEPDNGRFTNFEKACLKEAGKFNHWGNKITTEQIHYKSGSDPELIVRQTKRFCEEVVKNRKVIFIKRSGPSCIQSKMKRTGKSFEQAREKYSQSVEALVQLRQCCANFHELKFEDLLADTESELRELCHFLEIDYAGQMLEGYGNKKLPNAYQKNGIDRPEASDVPPHWFQLLKRELEQSGYQ